MNLQRLFSRLQGEMTRHANQQAKAKGRSETARHYRKLVKSTRGRVADLKVQIRKEAKRIESLQKESERARRAQRAGITVTEQIKRDYAKGQRLAQAKSAKKKAAKSAFGENKKKEREKETYSDEYWGIWIDTILARVNAGPHGTLLKTPVANVIRGWIETNVTRYGVSIVGPVCEKAYREHPVIFEWWIYESDGTGSLSNEAFFILEGYAREFIFDYTKIEMEVADDIMDDTTGFEAVYDEFV